VYGFQAISHYNGWSMAVAGALIVMSGLAVLSFIISQLPRLIGLFEGRKQKAPPPASAVPAEAPAPDRCPADINETAEIVRRLSDELGEEFDLIALYKLCQEKGFPHPHLTIKCLREAGLLLSRGDGIFSWEA